jgi:hypothetical protein
MASRRSIGAGDGQPDVFAEGPMMDAYERRRFPVSAERQFQTLRTLVTSSGLLPADRFIDRDRHVSLIADFEWDRLTHQTNARPRPFATVLASSRRWLGNALIRAGHRFDGTSGTEASQDLPLGHGGATS